MTEEIDSVPSAIREHGNQLGNNLVYLKKFLKARQEEQFAFLKEQREASDKAQTRSNWAAFFSAIAAGAAAIATILLAYDALKTP